MAHEARSDRARLSVVGRPARGLVTRSEARSLAGAALALPPLALLGVAVLLAFRGGGIVTEQWAPVAVGTAVALAVLGAVGSLHRIPRTAWPALGALVAFFGWSILSMLWSASPEATVESVVRLSLLVLAAVVGASYAARPSAARAFAVALALVGTLLAITVEVRVLAGSTATFSTTRLVWPIDYANGEAALLWIAFPALLAGAAAERIRPLGRALVASVAALTLAEGLMTLSRGAAIALVATLIVCVVFATERARLALTLASIALPVVLVAPRLTGGRPAEIASDAATRGRAAALAAAAAAVIVGLLASAEHIWPRTFARGKGPAAVAVWACIVAIGTGAFVVHYGRPDTWLSARWHEFRNPELPLRSDASRFGTATSARYDYWRVAAHSLEAHPLNGEGAGAFAVPWFEQRSIDLNVGDAHSWEAASLAETGVIGFLLLGAALLIPLVRCFQARHVLGDFATVALGGTAAYFVLHGSLDWLLLIPAVALPAFVTLGACAAAGSAQAISIAPARQRVAVAAGALAAAVVAVPVYLSTTLTARAENQAATSTHRALQTLSLAARLNPWAVQPLLVRSEILGSVGNHTGALAAAEDSVDRGPKDWAAWVALADARRQAGDVNGARAALRKAKELNPRGRSGSGLG
jgi:cytochrome c-type biogenesis protein CcmH/NrfG